MQEKAKVAGDGPFQAGAVFAGSESGRAGVSLPIREKLGGKQIARQGSMTMVVPQQCWLSVFQGEARVEKGVSGCPWVRPGLLVTTDSPDVLTAAAACLVP
jgi:hypothetical protein